MTNALQHNRHRIAEIVNPNLATSNAPISLNGAASTASVAPDTGILVSHTVNAGNNRLMLVGIRIGGDDAVLSVTYNGNALSFLDFAQYAAGNNGRIEIWYMVAPEVGTFDVEATFTINDYGEIGVIVFDNIDQVSPFYSTSTNISGIADAIAEVTVPSPAINIAFAAIAHEGIGTPYGGQTDAWSITSDGNWWCGAGYSNTLNPTISWTVSTNSYGIIGISLNNA